ncbi:DNA-binding protein [Dyella acidisoli]|uniref:Integrase n=1 Tax=Dyella acidisoli TaxID=1867834 RepID=A0ABQ5XK87_9GAMM|nr:DNA-binding protein [Dyella acidisoli]GLQ91599.1 integrase [Dyella acidisoli]
MARGGIYRTDIEKARNTLIAQGKRPSVDAVRVALGNTGSKTTIHRYLKELEAEDTAGGDKFPISGVLADLVGRLAGRLNEEADAKVAEATLRFEAQRREQGSLLEQARRESADALTQLQRTETALHEERAQHDTTRQALSDTTAHLRQLEERITGLQTRLAEHEAHAQSLEEKHQHARDALEHYRTSIKEQRDQEQRRHEHQVQELQVALRQANETLTAKNHDLMQLNRDNGRLTEHVARLDKDLQQARSATRLAQEEVATLKPVVTELADLRTRWGQDVKTLECLRADLEAATRSLDLECVKRQRAEDHSSKIQTRLSTLEEILSKLQPSAVATLSPST